MRNLIKLFTFTILLGAALFSIYASASSNSGTKASGEGTAPISGWEVSNIHYQLANDPSLVKAVSFDLDAPASSVSVKLNSNSTTYTSCTNLNNYNWQCNFSEGISLSSMDEIHVIAVGN